MYDDEIICFSYYFLSGPDITMHHPNSPFITHFVAQFVAQNILNSPSSLALETPGREQSLYSRATPFRFLPQKGHDHGS
jgi:hypothetical protein